MVDTSNLQEWLSKAPKYTTFRVNMLLDNIDLGVLKTFLSEQSKDLNISKIPNVYFIRKDCLVVEQWPLAEDIKTTGREVIVDSICAAAVFRGAHVFAPGVIGLTPNIGIDEIVDVYGDLEGKCKRGLKVCYEGRKQLVGIGHLKQLRRNIFDDNIKPSGIAVHITMPASKLPVLNENLYQKGHILLQNLPSIVCGWVLDTKAHEVILDMCAAPGNKTTHLAEMANDKAYIVAIDKTQSKVDKIKNNCDKHGVTSVHSYVFDSTKCFSEKHETVSNGPPFSENSFDKILLDAPCSGLGQRPQLNSNINPKVLESYKFVQRKLMTAAVKVLKVGGKLVYSTCTTTIDENEGMVSWALGKFPDLQLIPADPLLGGPGWPNCGLNDKQRVMVQRFGPEVDELRKVEDIYKDTIGFFIACFTKTC